ncbi:hypothetical protein PF003_g2509 [Phytophthora fragariae]|nr:hypothetical protein PF003_g2509 [Phytophthora fragariae]
MLAPAVAEVSTDTMAKSLIGAVAERSPRLMTEDHEGADVKVSVGATTEELVGAVAELSPRATADELVGTEVEAKEQEGADKKVSAGATTEEIMRTVAEVSPRATAEKLVITEVESSACSAIQQSMTDETLLTVPAAIRVLVSLFSEITANDIRQKSGRRENNAGELLPSGVADMLAAMEPLDERDVFLDVGAGIGNVLAQVALTTKQHGTFNGTLTPTLYFERCM